MDVNFSLAQCLGIITSNFFPSAFFGWLPADVAFLLFIVGVYLLTCLFHLTRGGVRVSIVRV